MQSKGLGLVVVALTLSSVYSDGTTKGLKEIFIGRCHEFFSIVQPKATPKNCTLLWNKFHNAFGYKDACNTRPANYQDFMESADARQEIRKSLFWEATKDTVEVFTRTHTSYVALGNTLQGYIGNDLIWCGGQGTDGINYTHCPSEKQCGFEIWYPYWAYASKQFSKKVRGVVYVLLNGSRTDGLPTYSRKSYFATLELPFMDNKTVTELKIWIIYDLLKGPTEKCGEKSLKLLAEDAGKYGIKMTCTDNPRELRPLMCNKYEGAEVCKNLGLSKTSSAQRAKYSQSMRYLVLAFLVLKFCSRL